MFSDPQSVTLNSVAQSLPKIEVGPRKGVYRKSDGTLQETISHTPTKNGRVRSMIRLDQFAVVTDPLGESDSDFQAVYIVWDRPNFGFTQTQVEQLTAALTGAVNVGGVVGKIFGGES
jgi:hypothetical protein